MDRSTPGEITLLSGTLRELHESGQYTVAKMADLWNLHPSSVYRYLTETDPGFDRIRLLFRQCGVPAAQEKILDLLTVGTGWVCIYIDTDLDVDGDGDIDTDDVMSAGIDVGDQWVAQLKAIRDACRDGHITDDELSTIEKVTQQLLRDAMRVVHATKLVHDQQTRRRKCRPLTVRRRKTGAHG